MRETKNSVYLNHDSEKTSLYLDACAAFHSCSVVGFDLCGFYFAGFSDFFQF